LDRSPVGWVIRSLCWDYLYKGCIVAPFKCLTLFYLFLTNKKNGENTPLTSNTMGMSEFNTKTYTRNIFPIAISYMNCILYGSKSIDSKTWSCWKINDIIIDNYSGKQHHLLSFDEVEGDTHNIYK